MKKFKKSVTIFYSWWRTDGKDVKKEHTDALEQTAQHDIGKSMKFGNTSGELFTSICLLSSDPEDGIEYRGYWEVKEN